jgi:MFS family permease
MLGDRVQRRLAGRVYYGWVITGVSFLVIAAIWSVNVSFGVFFEAILETFGRSRADTSLVFSVQTLVLYFSAALFGGAVDRYGTRPTLAVGTVVFATGLLLTSRASSLAELYVVYGLITGVGMGLIYLVGYTTVPRWFKRRRGTAAAAATTGNGVGVLLVPPVVAALILLVGWQAAYGVVTVVLTATLLLATVLVADHPYAAGVDPTVEFPDGYETDAVEERWRDQMVRVIRESWSPSFLLMLLGFGGIWLSVFTNYVHLVALTTAAGLSRSVGVLALSAMGGASIPGRFLLGVLADRTHRATVFVASGVGMTVAMWLLPVVDTPATLLGVAVLFGVMYGGNGALVTPLVADLYGTGDINARYGLSTTAFGVAGFVGPFVAGWMYDLTGTYLLVFLTIGSVTLVGSGCVYAATRLR